jgi:hypothetical protein
VARILQDRAQFPEEGMGEFIKAIWKIVQDAIDEVCAKPKAVKTSPQDSRAV